MDIWLELKAPAEGNKPEVRPSQVAWHTERALAGGKSFFLIEYRRVWYLYDGRLVTRLRKEGLSVEPIVAMAQGDYHRLVHYLSKDRCQHYAGDEGAKAKLSS